MLKIYNLDNLPVVQEDDSPDANNKHNNIQNMPNPIQDRDKDKGKSTCCKLM